MRGLWHERMKIAKGLLRVAVRLPLNWKRAGLDAILSG